MRLHLLLLVPVAGLLCLGQTIPVRVSATSPFPSDCNGSQAGTNYRNGEVEPWVTADPSNPQHLVGVWQQDRWSNGGASGLVAGLSFDGGQNWGISFPHFSRCAGGTTDNGGDYDRASDPWSAIATDGTVYFLSLSFNASNRREAILVSRSGDGGLSWSEPVALIRDTSSDVNDDKPSLTADPYDPNLVYAVWDRSSGLTAPSQKDGRAPAWFARTIDGGRTWEPARILYDPGPDAGTIGNQIVVLPDGTLVNLFTLILNASAQRSDFFLAVVRSSDKGLTWSDPIIISDDQASGAVDVKARIGVRDGATLASIAVDAVSGALYVTWIDGRFSGGKISGIALAQSADGGLTWSAPVQVNQAPAAAAFTPAIAVGPDSSVGLTYYDVRNDTDDPAVLLTNYWLIVSRDGGASWSETALAGPFDLLAAPRATNTPFLGDYQGLVPWYGSFLGFFVAANTGDQDNPSDVFAAAATAPGP